MATRCLRHFVSIGSWAPRCPQPRDARSWQRSLAVASCVPPPRWLDHLRICCLCTSQLNLCAGRRPELPPSPSCAGPLRRSAPNCSCFRGCGLPLWPSGPEAAAGQGQTSHAEEMSNLAWHAPEVAADANQVVFAFAIPVFFCFH